MHRTAFFTACLAALAVLAGALPAQCSQLQLLLPLGRTLYQTNEVIDVSAVRSDTAALSAGTLNMIVTGADGSKLTFAFPVDAVAAAGGSARTTENLHVNGWLLRPGKYSVEVDCDGATANTTFTVYSAIRKSTYKTVHWGGPSGDNMVPEGQDGMGFNVILTGDVTHQEPSIQGGEDVLGNDLMGGGHQYDLRATNDWSDPNVYLGAIQRGMDRAFSYRTLPNAIGAHLYDEPGLTWLPNPHYLDPKTHQPIANDQDIAPQRAAMERAFNRDPLWSDQVQKNDPQQWAQWTEQNDFKLGFMDAAWKSAVEAISRLKPEFDVITQSQYGWSALFDGYYFNVVRSTPIISGHGGYDDFGQRNFNPSWFLEMARARTYDRPNWYLPEWNGVGSDEYRLEYNMCFMTGIQGMDAPPGMSINALGAPGVTTENRLFQRIGTIFTKPQHTPQPLAVLYSKSNEYYDVAETAPDAGTIYMATKLIQYPTDVVLDEDVIDGTVAANNKAVIVPGVDYLDPAVVTGLQDFIKNGGVVLETKDCKVPIQGAIVLPVDPDGALNAKWKAANAIADPKAKSAAQAALSTFDVCLNNAKPVAAAIKTALESTSVRPAFISSIPTIAAGRQVLGDIEYIFAVNFTTQNDPASGLGTPVAAHATITLPDDGRPVYDAVTGNPVSFIGGKASLDFAPAQMYAFARPVRPIGGVDVGVPQVSRDFTSDGAPINVAITASLVDAQHTLIAGTCPMEIKVTDPLGGVRYDIYRAANLGELSESLPLAANDPAGKYTVTVTELLSGTQGASSFVYHPAMACGDAAGETHRAVFFWADQPNIYRFFRDHRNVTVVPGSSDYDQKAAQRLVDIFKPYNVNITIESLADASKAIPLTDEQAATWCGDQIAGSLDANARNNPQLVGYNLPGPTVLIGNADDNALIAFLQKVDNVGVLPYKPTADFPGVGHGMVAWNYATLGHDIESIALIGNDDAGVNEAVGTAFQIGIGVDPLTPYALPTESTVTAATMVPTTAATAQAN